MATKTWDGSDTSWNTAGNWSPSGVPGSGDDVVFDNTNDQDCTCDVAIDILSLDVQAGYDGTLDFANSAYAHSIGTGGATFAGSGGFDLGDSTVTCSGSWTSSTQSGWVRDSSTVILDGSGVDIISSINADLTNLTIAAGASVTLSASTATVQEVFGKLEIIGTFIINERLDMEIGSDIRLRSTGTLTINDYVQILGDGWSVYEGGGTIDDDGTGVLAIYSVIGTTINLPAGDYSGVTTLLVYDRVSFVLAAGTSSFNDIHCIDNNDAIGQTIDMSAATTVNINGDFYMTKTGAGNVLIDNSGSADMNISGGFELEEDAGKTTWTKGTGLTTFDVATTYEDKTADIQNIGDVEVTGALTLASDLTCDDFTGTTGSLNMGGAYELDATGDLDWASGFAVTPANGCTVTVGVNFTCNAQTLTAASATWNLDVTGTAVASGIGDVDYCTAGGTEITATGWTDSLNNTNWDFGAEALTGTVETFENASPFDQDESIDTVSVTGGTPPYTYEILAQYQV